MALAIGCGSVACGTPARAPFARTITTTSNTAAAPTTDTTSARPHGGVPREALVFPLDTHLELYPLERALLVARVVQEDPATARTPGLELHLLGTSNPPPVAALHAGLPAAPNTAYVHGRVQTFVGRWPDAAYAIVLDDPGDPQKLAELAISDNAPAQLFRWTGQVWSAVAPFTNVARTVSVGGGLLATRSLQRGPRDEPLLMFAGYEFASAFDAKAPKPAPADPPGSFLGGRAATRMYWPASVMLSPVRPRALHAPLLATAPAGDLFVGGYNVPMWVKALYTQQASISPSPAPKTVAELELCDRFVIEHFRPNAESSTVHSLDNPSSRFTPGALAARSANDVYFVASESLFAQETYLVHYDGAQWSPESLPADLLNTIAMASTPRALWLLALRGEPGRAREPRDLALWRMDRPGQAATWSVVPLPRDVKPVALAAVGTSVWVSAVVLDDAGERNIVYELSE